MYASVIIALDTPIAVTVNNEWKAKYMLWCLQILSSFVVESDGFCTVNQFFACALPLHLILILELLMLKRRKVGFLILSMKRTVFSFRGRRDSRLNLETAEKWA